ncbi:TRAP transporter large permease [Xanthobacter oligotrophicus]|uniref:TRAP transporter large permease protein n=1 Tax=Xanthobacter oligotrophicus TaxID=2607286 RepID=A0ABW6ZU89_9HYPH|nr:TRAP transporter large permease [Xanthobacter oligotrophicus]MCG5237897.1 TRAP transporter large permease [Xanthobacter oligotrophicus]
MSGITIGLAGFGFMLVLMALRIHIGIAMFTAGSAIYLVMNQGNLNAWLFTLNDLAYARLSNYNLSVIPLCMLMGQFATHGGLSRSLFRAAGSLIGHWRGGLAMSSSLACIGFGAISGSSLATAATMGQVALPELLQKGYSGRLATATLAASGTLGILVPPSVPLVVYAVLTQESIGKLFAAAVIPGIIALCGYLLVIRIIVSRDPDAGPASAKASWRERIEAQFRVLPVVGLFLVIVVGIYGGWASPTEATSIGAAGTGLIALVTGGLRLPQLLTSIYRTAIATAMIFLVLLGADLLNSGLALSQLPVELADWVKHSGLPPLLVLACILGIYILLGCVMDSLAMLFLTVPIFYPVIMGLDFYGMSATDKSVWFGILVLMVVEIGLVHPPVGMNLYIINKLAKGVPMRETALGVMPFLASDFARIVLLVLFPAIPLFLVRLPHA